MRTPKKRTSLALAGSAALVAGVVVWPAGAAAAPEGEVLEGTFETDRVEEVFLDHDANGVPSLGDELVYTNTSTGGLGDATDRGHCVFHQVDLAADSTVLHCTATNVGPRGSLTVQGVSRTGITAPVLREPSSWAVTGGTGEFASASGEIHIEEFEGAGLDFRSRGTFRIVLGG
ncbi:hypothetical protein GCM10027261_09930 [Geodermatophilus arenarius]|uniref:Dirigent-like protein n=1 Tax=Geodermatophilus arenarius TaxID=1137990 RepID=A0ABV9LEA0_9ACTN